MMYVCEMKETSIVAMSAFVPAEQAGVALTVSEHYFSMFTTPVG